LGAGAYSGMPGAAAILKAIEVVSDDESEFWRWAQTMGPPIGPGAAVSDDGLESKFRAARTAGLLASFIRALADEDQGFGVPVPPILRDEARRLIGLRWDPMTDPVHGGPGHVGLYQGYVEVLAREKAPDTTPDSEFLAPPAIRDEARKLLRMLRGEQRG
jgi:hypothetical protein